jgi:hypothetical protein
MAYDVDVQSLYAVLRAAAGIIIALILAYIVCKDWPLPKMVKVVIWAIIGAIGGAVIGMADNEIETAQGALLGAFWGGLLAFIGLSNERRKDKDETGSHSSD